jgi:hypothetical protein
MAAVDAFSPAGNTVAANAAVSSSSVYVTSLQPVSAWYCVNTGTAAVQLRFNANLDTTVTSTFPAVGTPSLGPVIAAGASQVIAMPAALWATNSSGLPYGRTSNVQIAVSAASGTNTVMITPVVFQS